MLGTALRGFSKRFGVPRWTMVNFSSIATSNQVDFSDLKLSLGTKTFSELARSAVVRALKHI